MILRNVPNHRIPFILGANGEGRQRVRRVPSKRVSCIDYFFINRDEMVRPWLLSNLGLDAQLNLMIHFYRDEGDRRPATPAVRAHQYHHEGVVANWADSASGHMGNMHYRAPYIPPKFD